MSESIALTEDSVPQKPEYENTPALECGARSLLVERAAVGLGLSALFGLALGMHAGGMALVKHTLAIPSALLLTTSVSIPSLFIVLSMLGIPLRLAPLLAAVSTGLYHAGRVLSGLAPTAALLVVTIRDPSVLALVARGGLNFAGALALYRLVAALREANREIRHTPAFSTAKSLLAVCGFVVLVVNLAEVTFATLLPVF